MHTNHRRKNKFVGKQHNRRGWPLAYSLTWWRREAHREMRAAERRLIHHGRYDELPTRYPRDIYWKYW